MKRGFTLIELLAVIVILAIIALIAVPIVVNIIDDSKKESIKRSAELYLDTVEKRIVKENLEKKYDPQYCEGESGEELTCYDSNNNSLGKINIEIKNKVPKNIKLYLNNGKIIKDETLELEIEGYFISSNTKGEIVLKISKEEDKKCVLYEDILDGEMLTKTEYVDYTGYTEYTNGMDIPTAYQSMNMTFTPATFDTTTKKWTVGDTGSGHAAYYTVQEAGYYQITVENGEITYVMNAQDEKIASKYMQGKEVKYIENTSSEITHLESGEKILIMRSTLNSSFYITKSSTLTNKCEDGDYRGYYADIDDDDEVDGIIYADLAFSSREDAYWGIASYAYTAKTNLNEYELSKNKYNGQFGEKNIIKLKKKNGTERFYVMALEDFSSEDYTTFTFYRDAYQKMDESDTSDKFGNGYTNTGKIIEIWNKNGTGAGSYSGAIQDLQDIFGNIQEEYTNSWYIPSKEEWTAFADYMSSREKDKITFGISGDYKTTYELSDWYWSSSQNNADEVWVTSFNSGQMQLESVSSNGFVRLGATF